MDGHSQSFVWETIFEDKEKGEMEMKTNEEHFTSILDK
jgi:hypothetical protein